MISKLFNKILSTFMTKTEFELIVERLKTIEDRIDKHVNICFNRLLILLTAIAIATTIIVGKFK
jgi:hypothetical protein